MKTLKELRSSYGLTQKELANLFEVSDRTIQNIERDSSNISRSLLSKYMEAFNISYDDIFLGNKYENFVYSNERKKTIIFSFNQKQKQKEKERK
ncbi:helix-turn-helix transcriptional regulator [Melissococcus plutonius]|uniref:helix-turn-helix transcriptional regulator n=1 Tax=Melissococcus plutonius TaxID=33970 RepID=UPI003C2F3C6E